MSETSQHLCRSTSGDEPRRSQTSAASSALTRPITHWLRRHTPLSLDGTESLLGMLDHASWCKTAAGHLPPAGKAGCTPGDREPHNNLHYKCNTLWPAGTASSLGMGVPCRWCTSGQGLSHTVTRWW